LHYEAINRLVAYNRVYWLPEKQKYSFLRSRRLIAPTTTTNALATGFASKAINQAAGIADLKPQSAQLRS
jgi:hypothetical protein